VGAKEAPCLAPWGTWACIASALGGRYQDAGCHLSAVPPAPQGHPL
jgi:hypothetical protein